MDSGRLRKRSSGSFALEAGLVLLILASGAYLRFDSVHLGGFVNYDAAGITYNADAIARGELPYRDTAEMKAIGPFLIASGVFAAAGRSLHALALFANLWILAAGLVLWRLARYMYGWQPALVTLLLFCAYSVGIDKIDFNYETWLTLPYFAAALCAWRASETDRDWLYGAAGACALWAGLMRHQGGFVLAVPLALALMRGARGKKVAWAVGGAVAGIAPLVIWYGTQGALGSLIRGLFLSEWGWRYVASVPEGQKLARLWEGLGGAPQYLGFPLVLCTSVLLSSLGGRLKGRRAILLWSWTIVSFAGTAVGYRFYQSYFMQLLGPVALLAAHPVGPLGAMLKGTRMLWPAWALAGITAAASVSVIKRDVAAISKIRKSRAKQRDTFQEKVGRHIAQSSEPGDTILCWARHSWAVYFYANRKSPSHIYKSTGLLTTPNNNSIRRETEKIRFIDSPLATEFLKKLKADPPLYLVLDGSSWRSWRAFKSEVGHSYIKQNNPKRHGTSVWRHKRRR